MIEFVFLLLKVILRFPLFDLLSQLVFYLLLLLGLFQQLVFLHLELLYFLVLKLRIGVIFYLVHCIE